MRAKIQIHKTSSGVLPFDYQYALASMLYRKLAVGNIRLANASHATDGFKLYTFSNFVFPRRREAKGGLQFSDAYFFLSSPDVEFVRSFAEGLLQEPEFQLYGAYFVVTGIEILQDKEFRSPCVFKTLSPIFLKTQREKNGMLVEWDLYPTDGKFHENIRRNLVERYTEFYGQIPQRDHFEILSVQSWKPKRIVIGGGLGATPRRCSLMTFTVDASTELLRFAYDAGFGEKNAMGFGCVDVVEPRRNLKDEKTIKEKKNEQQ
ncbi:MAG: CRISPR-associated endoribonuclease Cas6 [Candidatus Thermoplasmatota archaeon]